jgi:hypothetical protein
MRCSIKARAEEHAVQRGSTALQTTASQLLTDVELDDR